MNTDCGGTKEVLQDVRWFIPVKNPDNLADKIVEVANMSISVREKLGKQNRELI